MINLQTATNKNLLQADILKVGHHGSKDSTNTEFLNLIKPSAAVISCGAGNSYGHPNSEALERLSDVEIYRTDLSGTIIANCFDGGFNIETHKNIVLDKR
jgi:competence protein ComEC